MAKLALSLDLATKFRNTIIFGSNDTILAQRFLGIKQNQCFALFQRRRLCHDFFSTLADEFGDFGAVFGTALKEINQTLGYKKHGGRGRARHFHSGGPLEGPVLQQVSCQWSV